MGNFGKEALTPDTQLTFTCFLKKRFFDGQLLHQGPEGVLYQYLVLGLRSTALIKKPKNELQKQGGASHGSEAKDKSADVRCNENEVNGWSKKKNEVNGTLI